MNKIIDRIKQEFEANPLQTIAVGALAATAVAKLIDARSTAKGCRTWEMEVNRRLMNMK